MKQIFLEEAVKQKMILTTHDRRLLDLDASSKERRKRPITNFFELYSKKWRLEKLKGGLALISLPGTKKIGLSYTGLPCEKQINQFEATLHLAAQKEFPVPPQIAKVVKSLTVQELMNICDKDIYAKEVIKKHSDLEESLYTLLKIYVWFDMLAEFALEDYAGSYWLASPVPKEEREADTWAFLSVSDYSVTTQLISEIEARPSWHFPFELLPIRAIAYLNPNLILDMEGCDGSEEHPWRIIE